MEKILTEESMNVIIDVFAENAINKKVAFLKGIKFGIDLINRPFLDWNHLDKEKLKEYIETDKLKEYIETDKLKEYIETQKDISDINKKIIKDILELVQDMINKSLVEDISDIGIYVPEEFWETEMGKDVESQANKIIETIKEYQNRKSEEVLNNEIK